MTRSPARSDVAVDGGTLALYTWEAPDGAPTVVAIHGVTSSHAAWAWLADALPGVRIVAPDLRGRGRSRDLGGPYGMGAHADDVAAVVRAVGGGPHVVLGHSMGGFVAVVLAHRHPELVRELVLVDGGLPLAAPAGTDPEEAMRATLGPAADRLRRTYDSAAEYRAFWRTHPVFATFDDPRFDTYSAHDLAELADGRFQPATQPAALSEDQVELVGGGTILPALTALDTAVHPTTFVHAPRGLLDGAPLYPADDVRHWATRLPGLRVVWSPETNHYTIVMSDDGAAGLTEVLRPVLQGATR